MILAAPSPIHVGRNLSLIICGVVLLTALIVFLRTRKRLASFVWKRAEVLEVKDRPAKKGGGLLKHPVIRYQGDDGQPVVYESSEGRAQWGGQPGTWIDVLVHKDRPGEVEMRNFMNRWGASIALTIGGVSFLGCAIAVYFLERLTSKSAKGLFAKIDWLFIGWAIFCGLVSAVLAVIMYRKTCARIRNSYVIQGEVIEFKERPGGEGLLKFPVIRYRKSDGQEHAFESSQGRSHWKIKPGDSVEILVDKSNERDARLADFFSLWFLTCFFAVGAVFGLIFVPIVMRLFFSRWH